MKILVSNKITIIITLAILTILFVAQANFILFDEKPAEIIKFKHNISTFAIYYIPPNAAQQEYIQFRKVFSKDNFKVLDNFKRYQILTSHKLLNDSLQLVLADTSSYRPRQDTVRVKIE